MTEGDSPVTEVERIAGGLTEAQRILINGDYDPEFARIEDASKLVSLGLWSWDAGKYDPESEYYDLTVTPLGHAVREHLIEKDG